ncbi:MAG: peptidoglycan-binding protein [Henriciella sp.]|jgi:localization factor PodJL
MSQFGSWSVKGIDDRARAAAKEKARIKGVTLGDYINDLLLQGHSEAGPRNVQDVYDFTPQTEPTPKPSPTALDGLARRLESIEARSTLAITGIDQSVLGLLARLENSENSSSAMAAEIDAMIDELRETHEALQSKVQEIDADDTAQQNLEAMKALEGALGKLASHVYEESSLAQDETNAIKGRVESGFADLTDRVEGMEVKVESTLADAAKRVEKAVEQAELRAEGTSRHLSERFSAIESGVATKLSKVEEVDTRVSVIEDDVSGAITSMEGTLVRIQERLNRAENTTDAALKALEHTFASLDERIESVAEHANPEKAEALRKHFEDRFEGLAADLRASVEQSRTQLANEIEQAAAGDNPELMGRLEATVDTLKQQLVTGEERSSRALEAVSEQVNRLSNGVNTRLTDLENREDALLEGVTEKVADLANGFDERVAESERRSAAAIEQVGAQVATAIQRVQARQETTQQSLEDSVAAASKSQEARLSKALGNISERLAAMQNQTVSAVSPVQKAIASLAARLEAVEDFSAPPHAQPPERDLPVMPEITSETEVLVSNFADDLELGDAPMGDFLEDEQPVEVEEETESESDFVAGLPDFSEPETTTPDFAEDFEAEPQQSAPETDPEAWAVDEPDMVDADYFASDDEPELVHNYVADLPSEEDPLTELGGWNDAHDEARDTDVFASSDDMFADEPLDIAPEPVEGTLATPPDLPIDDDATDYLARARKAAIAAATVDASSKKAKAPKTAKGRRSAASASPKAAKSGGGKSKLPIIAAASVLAIATAGAGAYVALRGQQDAATPSPNAPEMATVASMTETAIADPSTTSEDVAAAEMAENAALEDTLFDPETGEGLAAATDAENAALATDTPSADPVEAATIPENLPVIAKRLTLERAAIEGSPVAQFKWGEARLDAKDYAAGSDFVRRAAQQGLPAAQYRLGKLHEEGLGVSRDPAEARSWVEKAARGGNVKAMHDLAVFYVDGEGGSQSYAAAAEWFRKAADFGLVDSQYNLAVLYENGLGISPSQVEALYWYEVAAANGDASAPANVAALRETLPLEQAQQAGRRATSWAAASAVPASNGNFGPQNWENGSRAQVRDIQTVLNGLGYDAGVADGFAGAGTRTAIRAFQTDAGLPTDGEISDDLVNALNAQTQS